MHVMFAGLARTIHIHGVYAGLAKTVCTHRIYGSGQPYVYAVLLGRKVNNTVILGVYGRPRANPPPNRANKLPTQFKAPNTSSECRILDVISKP